MMTLTHASKFCIILTGLMLSGCSLGGEMTPIAAEPDVVSTRIAQASEKAAAALDTIAGIEQQRAPQMPPTPDYSTAPAALTQSITVKWSGPLEKMAETLAVRAGMKFQSIGGRPGVPLLVSIDVYQKPLIEVLHDLGLQAGRRADISVNSSNNTIEIRYAPVDRT